MLEHTLQNKPSFKEKLQKIYPEIIDFTHQLDPH